MRHKKLIIFSLLVLLLLILASTAFAANYVVEPSSSSDIINGLKPFGTLGQGTTDAAGNTTTGWASQLQNFATALVQAGRIVSVIMVAVGGVMVAFGVESANKTVWNAILGIGLAINMGSVVFSLFGPYATVPTDTATTETFKVAIAGSDDDGTSNYNILGEFMKFYTNTICAAGAAKLVPIATNLTLILVIIDATIKVSTDLLGGDKLKFITQMCLKTGFMLFLIHNWFGGTGLNLMGSLGEAFQDIGFAASGITNGTLQPNDIVNNGMKMFTTVWAKMSLSIMHPVASLVELLMATALIIIIFLTALEMFMARVEFYTMALITIPLIPFGAIDQLKFLWEKALGAMFNLAIKLCVICFLQGVTTKALGDYCTSLAEKAESGVTIEMTILIQGLLMTVMFYFLVKKVPELVQGLLSGNPSLNGGSMMQTARDVGGKAATATGAAMTGGAAVVGGAVAGAKGGTGFKGKVGGAIGGAAGGAWRVGVAGAASAASHAPGVQSFMKGVEGLGGDNGLLHTPSNAFKVGNSKSTALQNLRAALQTGGKERPSDLAEKAKQGSNPTAGDAKAGQTSTSTETSKSTSSTEVPQKSINNVNDKR